MADDSSSNTNTFKCPDCGAPLEPDGDAKEVKCPFCGGTVIVPEELRDDDSDDDDLTDEEVAEQDPFAPSHVPWLIQHGVEVTVRVDHIADTSKHKDMTDAYLYLNGKTADGENFYQSAEASISPLTAIPRPGTMLKIKYNPDKHSDFILQIDGQFYYCWMKNNPTPVADTATSDQQIAAGQAGSQGDFPVSPQFNPAPQNTNKTGGFSAWKFILPVILICVVLACVGGILLYSFSKSGVSANAISTPRPFANVLFKDDFTDPSSGWNTRHASDYVYGYQGGGYRVLINKQGGGQDIWPELDRQVYRC